jgi:hypothetical protein
MIPIVFRKGASETKSATNEPARIGGSTHACIDRMLAASRS